MVLRSIVRGAPTAVRTLLGACTTVSVRGIHSDPQSPMHALLPLIPEIPDSDELRVSPPHTGGT